jgi:hypothetical protein
MALKAPVPTDYATAVHHNVVVWMSTFAQVMSAKSDACTAVRAPDGRWDLILVLFRGDGKRIQTTVPINPGGAPIIVGEEMTKWGFLPLGSSVWTLTPSLDSGDYHGFVVVRNVPLPAPWEPGTEASVDPDVNLTEQRELQQRLDLVRLDDFPRDEDIAASIRDLNRLSELAHEMDRWLSSGGNLPTAWRADGDRR